MLKENSDTQLARALESMMTGVSALATSISSSRRAPMPSATVMSTMTFELDPEMFTQWQQRLILSLPRLYSGARIAGGVDPMHVLLAEMPAPSSATAVTIAGAQELRDASA